MVRDRNAIRQQVIHRIYSFRKLSEEHFAPARGFQFIFTGVKSMNIKDIEEKYAEVLRQYPFGQKYFHLKSIDNFIIHLNEFGTQYYKAESIRSIDRYLNFILAGYNIDRDNAKQVFNEYIQPLGEIYSKRLKFIFYMRPSSIIFWVIVMTAIFFLFKLSIVFYIVLITIAILKMSFNYSKYKKRKVYGFDF